MNGEINIELNTGREKLSRNRIKKIIIALFIFFLFGFWCLWVGILHEIVPRSRTWFWSFESFEKKADDLEFPDKLPESADGLEFYWFEGNFDDKAGYYSKLSESDYQMIKQDSIERYKSYYSESLTTEFYLCENDNGLYVHESELENRGIDFLEEILPETSSINDYYFIAYVKNEGGSYDRYNCILGNDATNEIIEFSCKWANI
ncbi:MAG: hypothetical protein IJZ25_01220 [Lachnospiraceae bacterium]|nr:hypothetical protein [Lachnospiraceae bacterium]